MDVVVFLENVAIVSQKQLERFVMQSLKFVDCFQDRFHVLLQLCF